MRRRVLFVMENLEIGGAERQALLLARTLSTHCWEVQLALAQARGPLVAEAQRIGCRVHDLGISAEPASRLGAMAEARRAALRVMKICREQRITIVQSWFPWENVFSVPAAVLSPNVRGIVTCRRTTGEFRRDSKGTLLSDRVLNRLTDVVICNARSVKRDTIAREAIAPRRVAVIPNAVEAADLRCSATPDPDLRRDLLPKAGDGVLVVMLATLKAAKNQALFLRAFAAARQDAPQLRAALVGPDRGEEDRLRALAMELRLESHVRFFGPTDDPLRVLRAADSVALSSNEEGMPNAVLEAMACSRAVVATNTPGTEEALGRAAGILVPCGNEEALARALAQAATDPGWRQQAGRAGRRRVESRFSPQRVGAAWGRLYGTLSGKP